MKKIRIDWLEVIDESYFKDESHPVLNSPKTWKKIKMNINAQLRYWEKLNG
jgi:hypothetical protein